MPATRLLRIAEVQRRLDVSRSTVYRMLDAGDLSRVYVRPGCPRIPEADLDAFVAEAFGDNDDQGVDR